MNTIDVALICKALGDSNRLEIIKRLLPNLNDQIRGSIQFFFYDIIKICIFLCILILFISYIQSYFPPEKSKRILGNFHGLGANTVAALLGTITPFCSCSSIPLFIGICTVGIILVGYFFNFIQAFLI